MENILTSYMLAVMDIMSPIFPAIPTAKVRVIYY
jgi:hypothetical protein